MRYFLNKSLIITKKLNFSKQKFVQRLLFQPLTHTLTPTHPLTHTHTHIHTHTHTHTHRQTDRDTYTHWAWYHGYWWKKSSCSFLGRTHLTLLSSFLQEKKLLKQTTKEKILFQPSFQINPKAIRRSREN